MEGEGRAAEREFDVVIFGASGVAGKYVVREALKFLNHPSSSLKSLALAGRNLSKLSQTLKWALASSSSSSPPPSDIPILQADVSDPSSIVSLCRRAKLLLNCVGPFNLHGEPVVAACIECGTDYLDICGEPEFMERMEADYHERAQKAGSLVVSACGFDSVPAELGLMFHSRQWDFPAAPNQVVAYLSMESKKGHVVSSFATFESALLGMENEKQLQELRRSRPIRARPVIPGPRPLKGSPLERQKTIGLWALNLPSADSTVVRRTLVSLTENPNGLPGVDEDEEHLEKREKFWATVKPAYFSVKLGSRSLMTFLYGMTIFLISGGLMKTSFGMSLLLKYPEFFTLGAFRKTGPTEEELNRFSFNLWFVGHGYKDSSNLDSIGNKKIDMEVITRISGPEMGCAATSIILIQCALILLGQRGKLPQGGVFPPGIVFGPTDLQDRLQKNGISFDFVSKRNLHIIPKSKM